MTSTKPLHVIGLTIIGLSGMADPAPAQIQGWVGPSPTPAPGTWAVYPERIPLSDGSLAEAERGLLFVPMNRSRPSTGVIAIEVWRFPAKKPTDALPIFRLPGGPGFEGLDEDLRDGYYERVVSAYTQVADYIVVGQRGIGMSKPNTLCSYADGTGPDDFAQHCRAYWEARGLDVHGFTVAEAAADVHDAARAMGYHRIVLRGGSFGSHWATAVMHYFPDLVARAVLSGTEGPDHTYDSPTGLLRTLERIAAAAERDPAVRAVLPEGGLIGAVRSIYDRLSRDSVSVIVTDSIRRDDHEVSFTTDDVPWFAMGYSTGLSSREDVARWPRDILRIFHGEFEAPARQLIERQVRSESRHDPPGHFTAAEYLLDCASGASAERLVRLREDPAARLTPGDHEWYEEACDPWDVDVGDDFRRGFRTTVPTLVIHGTWDMSTPYDNALELMPSLKNGKLVTVVGGTHGAAGEALEFSPEFAEGFWNFVRTGDLSSMPDSVVLPPIDWVTYRER